MGKWFDVNSSPPEAFGELLGSLRSGDLLEFEVLDELGGTHGLSLCRVVGEREDAISGVMVHHVTHLGSERARIHEWLVASVSSPSGLHFCGERGPHASMSHSQCFIQPVERWRRVRADQLVAEWELAALREPGLETGREPRRPPDRPRGLSQSASDEVPGPRAASSAPLDGAMSEVARLEREMMPELGEPSTGVEPLLPSLMPAGSGLPESLLPRPASPVEEVRRPRPEVGEAAVGRRLVECANQGVQGLEPAGLSVRERLSARAGRLHASRVAKRVIKDCKAEESLSALRMETEEEAVRRKSKSKARRRKKRKRERERSCSASGSSSDESSSTAGSNQVFREASGVGSTSNHTTRSAREEPHRVLVDSICDILRVLPRSTSEAAPTTASVSRRLPAVYVAFYTQVLRPALSGSVNANRNDREVRTLCELLDHAINGDVMDILMIGLGRLKAILQSTQQDGGGWQAAEHHELIPHQTSLAILDRDRANLARDVRDSSGYVQALSSRTGPGRGKGGGPDRGAQR